MEEPTSQAPCKRRCSVYEVDGFRFRRKKKRTTEISTVETTQDETASSQKVATWNNHETALETETAPDESQENACALEQKERTKQLQCERISKDQSEEQRLKALCEAIWTDIYKETIDESLPEKGTLLRVLEDVRMGFLDQLTWYLDNPEQRAKTFSELYRPNPVNLELQTRIKSLEHDLSCYCNELLDWSKASSTLEQFTGENSHDSSFVPEERAKKISVHLSNPYQPQLTKLVKEATVSLDINFTELLEICRTILKYKDETAETIKNLNKWIYHCSFAGLADVGNPKKLLKSISFQ